MVGYATRPTLYRIEASSRVSIDPGAAKSNNASYQVPLFIKIP
jgi:hypothetical protein